MTFVAVGLQPCKACTTQLLPKQRWRLAPCHFSPTVLLQLECLKAAKPTSKKYNNTTLPFRCQSSRPTRWVSACLSSSPSKQGRKAPCLRKNINALALSVCWIVVLLQFFWDVPFTVRPPMPRPRGVLLDRWAISSINIPLPASGRPQRGKGKRTFWGSSGLGPWGSGQACFVFCTAIHAGSDTPTCKDWRAQDARDSQPQVYVLSGGQHAERIQRLGAKARTLITCTGSADIRAMYELASTP